MKTFKDFIKSNMKTLYVHRPVLNGEDIRNWFLKNGIDKTIDPSDMHITIAFSKTPINWNSCYFSKDKITLPENNNRYMKTLGEDGSAKVMCVKSDVLNSEWRYFKDRGASWDWPEYQPHITISYLSDINIYNIKPYLGIIKLGPMKVDQVVENWKDNVKEK